jgi:hypothetical protein
VDEVMMGFSFVQDGIIIPTGVYRCNVGEVTCLEPVDEWVARLRVGPATVDPRHPADLLGGTDSLNLPRAAIATTTAIQLDA